MIVDRTCQGCQPFFKKFVSGMSGMSALFQVVGKAYIEPIGGKTPGHPGHPGHHRFFYHLTPMNLAMEVGFFNRVIPCIPHMDYMNYLKQKQIGVTS